MVVSTMTNTASATTPAPKPQRFNTKPCRCGAVTSVLATDTHRGVKVDSLRTVGNEYVGPWFQAFTADSGATLYNANGRLIVPCRGCGVLRFAMSVRGVYSAKIKCDARCTHAKGHSCECACGGKNHGAGNEAVEVAA